KMKFATFAAVLTFVLASVSVVVDAQDSVDPAACTLCLQNALKAIPACANAEAPKDGSVSAEYATCLCASLDGAWADACSGASQCGSSIKLFKESYGANIQGAGLICGNGQASFVPPA
ncbi:hypothetical protein BGW38_005562, partial [Lunasporangiospora selenospora]